MSKAQNIIMIMSRTQKWSWVWAGHRNSHGFGQDTEIVMGLGRTRK